jgi:splicing factor U2AF subunit
VGNTPENTQEGQLMAFLNQALQQVNLCTAPGNPIIQCRVSQKFAFVELRSIEEANACLNITGIPFGGNMLKIGRPSKYTGPSVQTSTWQQLTGAQLDPSATDPNTKIYRELFIGNTSEGMSEVDLQEFLGAAMAQVGLTTKPGNPILTTRLSGKFAFVEIRSIEETNAALNMNGIPYMGMNLRVGRPSKYTGPQVPHMEWNELLAKFMAGELKPLAQEAPPTKVIKLGKMVTEADVASAEDHAEIGEDTTEECGKYGQVTSVVIPRDNAPGSGLVFVAFAEASQAAAASSALAGRTFDGRSVEASFYDEARFASGDYSG